MEHLRKMSQPWQCVGGSRPHVTRHGGSRPLVALRPLVAFWPINSEISALPGFLVNCQLGMGAWRPMYGQARRVLRLATTAAVVAPIANGSNHAPWFPSGARAWVCFRHGGNSANSDLTSMAPVGARSVGISGCFSSVRWHGPIAAASFHFTSVLCRSRCHQRRREQAARADGKSAAADPTRGSVYI